MDFIAKIELKRTIRKLIAALIFVFLVSIVSFVSLRPLYGDAKKPLFDIFDVEHSGKVDYSARKVNILSRESKGLLFSDVYFIYGISGSDENLPNYFIYDTNNTLPNQLRLNVISKAAGAHLSRFTMELSDSKGNGYANGAYIKQDRLGGKWLSKQISKFSFGNFINTIISGEIYDLKLSVIDSTDYLHIVFSIPD